MTHRAAEAIGLGPSLDAAPSASETRLRRLIDNLFVFVGLLDLDGRVTEANEAPLAAAGLARAEVLGAFFWDCHWWAWSEAVRERLKAAVAEARGGATVRYDVDVRLTGDALLRIDFQIAPLRDGEGRIVALVPSGVDIGERVRMEERLRESEARARREAQELDTIYRTAPLGFALFDRDLRVLRINEALAEINGHGVEAHLGRRIWDLVPSLRGTAEPLFRRVLAGETMTGVEIEGETARQPGVRRQWIEHFHPVRGVDGSVIGIGVICEEVTERRRAERRREFLYDLAERLRDDRRAAAVVADVLGRRFGVERAGWTRSDAAGEVLMVEPEHAGACVAPALGAHRLDAFGDWLGGELRAGRAVAIEDALADPRTKAAPDALLAIGARASLTVPACAVESSSALST